MQYCQKKIVIWQIFMFNTIEIFFTRCINVTDFTSVGWIFLWIFFFLIFFLLAFASLDKSDGQ